MQEKIELYKMSHRTELGFWDSPLQKKNSFEFEENEIHIMKLEEDTRKNFEEIRERLHLLEEDTGEMLILYKDIIFDK